MRRMRYKKDSNALTNKAFVTSFSENILQNKIIAPIFQSRKRVQNITYFS